MSAISPGSIDSAYIRPATEADLDAIFDLVKGYADMGNLLPRPRHSIRDNINRFFVAEAYDVVVGCGALEVFTADLAEVRSLVVSETHKRTGVGRLLVERLIDVARYNGHRRLMALTYVPGFFHRLGFETVSRELFPEKVWGICVNCYKFHHCDEIAVQKIL